MNCPACGAPLRLGAGEDSLTCDYCRSIYFPEKNDDGVRVLGEQPGESCPVCAIPLMVGSLAGVRIRYCTRCRGMLIPMEMFAALIDAVRVGQQGSVAAPAADESELRRRLSCPHCHQTMDTHFYAGPGHVIIEGCDRCCVNWLDHGDLMRIARAPEFLREGAEGLVQRIAE